jgi:hypothetical protein
VNSKHALLISVAVGAAAVAGTVAATKTVHLGNSAKAQPKVSSASIAARSKALDRTEIALRRALNQRPPKLPPLPKAATAPSAGSPIAASPAPQGQTRRVVYVRPAPIIRHVQRSGEGHEADDGSEHRGEGGFDD